MKKMIVLLFILLSFNCYGFNDIAEDKWLHFYAGSYLTILGQGLGYDDTETFLFVLLVGVCKELYDQSHPGNIFDYEEIFANQVGWLGITLYTHQF